MACQKRRRAALNMAMAICNLQDKVDNLQDKVSQLEANLETATAQAMESNVRWQRKEDKGK